MTKPQTVYPQWWRDLDMPARLREQLQALFTITRDGYVRWYKGSPRFVCGRKTDPRVVEDRWRAKCSTIDAATGAAVVADRARDIRTYRQVLSEFLAVQQSRVNAPKKAITDRTYHNYVSTLNAFGAFQIDDVKVADMDIRDIGPKEFTAYAARYGSWKASGFDSIVTLVGTLFRWAVGMEYIDRFRPGPQFTRPGKQAIRDDRIDLAKTFTPATIAQLYLAASHTVRCWIALGTCAAFTNSDIGHLPRQVVYLDAGVIDFRRRKTGKIRRVIPLPDDVLQLLRDYQRPEPALPEYAPLFFLTQEGHPYTRTKSRSGRYSPSNTISVLFARLLKDTGVRTAGDRRNFTGLRTSFYNLAPRGEWSLERKIVMGRTRKGDDISAVDLEHYLEDVGLDRLRHVVNHVWNPVRLEIDRLSTSHADAVAPDATVEQGHASASP